MDMAVDFESKFFDQLDDRVSEVRADIKDISGKIDQNTKVTNSIKDRVNKLDSKVFGKRQNVFSNLIQDRQIVAAFFFALLVFLLILASILHIKVPTL